MEEIEIELYETAIGKRPFEIWFKDIKEIHPVQNFDKA
jgi:hypothetical protein